MRAHDRFLRAPQLLLILLVCFVVGSLEVGLLRTYMQIGATSKSHARDAQVPLNFANVQREALVLQIEGERVLSGKRGNTERLRIRAALLENQLRVARASVAQDSGAVRALQDIEREVHEYVALLAPPKPQSRPVRDVAVEQSAQRLGERIAAEIKRLYDAEEYDSIVETAERLAVQRRTGLLLLAISGALLFLGIALAWSLRRRLGGTLERLASFTELNPAPLVKLAADGSIDFHNRAASRLAQDLGGGAYEPLLPSDRAAIATRALASGERERHEQLVGDRTLSWSFFPIGSQSAVHCYGEDVTDHRALEEQLRQSQKLEAVGHLAGGVAHDFNNLLTGILGYAELLRGRLGDGEALNEDIEVVAEALQQARDELHAWQEAAGLTSRESQLAHRFNNLLTGILGHAELLLTRLHARRSAHDDLEEIHRAAQRASDLTRQLLAFSRKQILQPKVLDLNTVVSSMGNLLQRVIGEHLELVIAPGTDLGHVRADPSQLEQVVMNLAVNARDAMPNGGKLLIETANVDLDDSYARQHHGTAPGQHVMLAVSDTGCGMDADTLARVFEPFFTTKEQGKGTGLGLSTVYGIVKQSGGSIWAYSEPGRGSTFKVYLPRVEAPLEKPTHQSAGSPDRGSETILLVEDERIVRELARRALTASGYTVIAAHDPIEALRLCEDGEGPIDLILTDVVMPKLSGPELARRLARFQPSAKVVFMSGYTEATVLQQEVLTANRPFIQKPFTPATLARKVRDALDATVGARS